MLKNTRKVLYIFLLAGLIIAYLTISAFAVSPGNTDPAVSVSYSLNLNNQVFGYFTEALNVGSSTEVVEHKIMDSKGKSTIQKIPGKIAYNAFVLKRSLTGDKSLWDWHQLIIDNNLAAARKNGSLIMYDTNLNAIAQWDFTNAWPSAVSIDTDPDNKMPVESITIVCDGIKRVK